MAINISCVAQRSCVACGSSAITGAGSVAAGMAAGVASVAGPSWLSSWLPVAASGSCQPLPQPASAVAGQLAPLGAQPAITASLGSLSGQPHLPLSQLWPAKAC